MTDRIQSIRDDIAYLKGLAEVAQTGSVSGGAALIAAGGLYGLASLAEWARMTEALPLSWSAVSLIWLAAVLLFVLALVVIRTIDRTGRLATVSLAWRGVGTGIFGVFACLAIASYRLKSPILMHFSPSILFAFYGAGWTVAAIFTRKMWTRLVAVASFAAALAMAWFITQPVEYLIYALALLLLSLVPGLLLLRSGRSG